MMTYNKNLNGVGKDKWYKGLIQNSRYCYLRFMHCYVIYCGRK